MSIRSGEVIQNGETCTVTGVYTHPEGMYELEIVAVRGRYPDVADDEMTWARNTESRLTVRTLKGIGAIAIRGVGEYTLVERIPREGEQTAVDIPAGTYYAWMSKNGGEFSAIAISDPVVDEEKHEVKTESEILREEGMAQLALEHLTQDDKDFLQDLDEEERVGYVYGRLLEEGEDPDEILIKFGVIEGSDT